MEKQQMTVDFEKQSFDNLGVNPYEIVVALSKTAREINDKAQKYLNPGVEINPVTMALRRLNSGARFTYDTDNAADARHSKET
jgi:DNA-directed RNA polymerase subunit K/omega